MKKYRNILILFLGFFIVPFDNALAASDDSTAVARISQVVSFIENNNRLVDQLDSSTFFNLPVGIKGKKLFNLCITEATIRPGGAVFTAVLQIDDPADPERKYTFTASNVPFSFKGGLQGTIRLALMNDVPSMPICKGVSLDVLKGSFVDWDCNGFERLKICADVNFSSGIFTPVNADGTDKINSKLSAYVETEVKDLNDLAFKISLDDPFKIKGIPDLIFTCKDLVIDRSDYSNPSGIQFPSNYLSAYSSVNSNLWKGIYVGEASVKLGKLFAYRTTNEQPSISVQHFIIDDNGLTGTVAADNILTLDQGNLGGWDFSVSSISISLLANKLSAAKFAGDMHIPVMKEGDNLAYSALIDLDGNYSFTVKPKMDMDFTMFGDSKLTLFPNSTVTVAVKDGKFIPTAILSGNMTLNAPFSKNDTSSRLKLLKVDFQEMLISAAEPVFDVKYFGVGGLDKSTFAAFPLTINQFLLRTTQDEARLSVGVKVNLKESGTGGFSGSTVVTLVAKRHNLDFFYKGLDVDKVDIDIDEGAAFRLRGAIAFIQSDPVYGNGFKGKLSAIFAKKFTLNALALFGNVNGFRYFYADGLLGINPGISVPPFIFNGFGGGLYYHMKQSASNDVSAFLASESGILYKPDKTIGIGVKSEIKFGVVKPELIDADAEFEIAFNSNGGINDINFKGFAKCLVPSLNVALPAIKLNARTFADGKSLAFDPGDSPLSVKLDMDMNFETEDFDASLEAFVRMDPVMQGVGPNGSAGRCVMHLGNSKWYIYLGTQTNPIGIKMLRMMETTSYFMAGYDIPTGMVVNPKVASILRINTSSCGADHDNSKLENGKGVAFGSCMAFSTGNIKLTPFYGGFDIGAGFDILLNNYGKGAYCEGHAGALGINGWYAKGQAYAYLDGNIGIEVKVFKRHKKFDILSIETAAQLDAEGPNPIYFEGQAGGKFRILGGMIKGNCKFKVSYGEQCKILNKVAESPLADLQLIGDVTPEADKTEVDVFTSPQAVFNVPVNQIMDISDDNNLNHKYRANLEKCELTLAGQTVPGSYQWNSDNSVLVYNPNDILSDKKEYNFLVSLSFDEWQNGQWTTLTDSAGAKTVETKSVKFTTGDFPKELPQSVISYSYPLNRQYNFYPKEYSKGYITFNKGLAPFFHLGPAWKQVARFVPVSGESALTSDLSYDASSKTVSFNIPDNISCDKIYQLQLVNIPQKVSIDNNVRAQTSSSENSAGTTDVTIKTASGSITEGEETAFYNMDFRTSKFKTFADKLSVTELKADMLYEISPYVYYLQSTFRNNEVFDKFEIYGEGTQTPLIRRTAQLGQSGWYQKNLAPLVYHTFPGNISVTWRDTSLVGCPPRGELKIWQWDYNHSLTDLEIQTGNATAINSWAQFMYCPPYYWSKDYTDIRTKLANFYPSMTNDNPQIESVLKKLIWPVIDKGNYPVKFEYVLPGINKVTTSKVINIEDPFDIAQPSL